MSSVMPEDRRAKALAYGRPKKPRQFTITDEASEMLEKLCDSTKSTRSDLIERMIRALYATQDEQLIKAFLARAVEGDRNVD